MTSSAILLSFSRRPFHRLAVPAQRRCAPFPYCPGGGDGHSFNDAVEYEEQPIYGYRFTTTWGERRDAIRQIRRICKEHPDQGVRALAAKTLRNAPLFVFWHEHSLCMTIVAVVVAVVGALCLLRWQA